MTTLLRASKYSETNSILDLLISLLAFGICLLVFVDSFIGARLDSWSGHKRSVEDILITPSGDHLYSCSSDSTVKKWDLKTGEELVSFVGHQTSVYAMFGLFDDDCIWSGNINC